MKQRVYARASLVPAAIVAVALIASSPYAASAARDTVPNFAPNDHTSWQPDRLDGDDFLPPESGPGPVTYRADHPYRPNGLIDFAGNDPTFRIADLKNPILQPWAVTQMQRDIDEVLAGKVPFVARERCYPSGVPAFLVFRRVGAPMLFFIQTPKEVLMIWRVDQQVRHIYLNVPHSRAVKPSWYGESVGHYEGDALIVDTIGLNARTFVDNYRTPHTEALHVVERFRLIEGGTTMEVRVHVEDKGAFRTPWNAVQRFERFEGARGNEGLLSQESLCADGASFADVDAASYGESHTRGLVPVPVAARPDF